ncbi:MAG: DUF4153 domain-containing protein [Rhodospirillum sp.]|nr:DUF4153 domain-containing protein [Rhodospirillum sp.]MCF8490200.1 DUF4153 domain-containing protein [Rhodospirillum sp.]MCF8500342.1 DUF4153 domain-containing protein [Rhodospirillum sp.]
MVPSAFHALSPSHLIRAWARAVHRFPVPVAAALMLTLLVVGTIHDAWPEAWMDTLPGLTLGLSCGVLASLGVTLRGEIRAWAPPLRHGLAVLALAFSILVCWTRVDSEMLTLLTFLPLGLFLLTLAGVLAGAPGRTALDGWREALGDLSACLFGIVVAVILGAGLCLWLVALDLLLGADTPGEFYGDIWVVALVLVWTLSALSRLRGGEAGRPVKGPTAEEAMPTWLAILIAGPLTALALGYLAVVVLYLGRLALEGRFMEGEIGLATALYLAFGVAVHLLSYPLREEGPLLSRFYCRWFPWTLPLPLVALIWALWVRVGAYGWTEARYLVAVLGLWLAVFAGLHLVRPKRAWPFVGPLVLGGLLVLASFGPWGARSISIASQVGRFETLVTDTPMARWTPGDTGLGEVDRIELAEVAELMDWLGGREALDRVAPLVAVEPGVLNTALNEVRWAPADAKVQMELSAEEGDVVTVNEPGRVVWFDLWGGGSAHWAVAEGLLTLDMDKGEIRLDPPESEEGAEPLARLELGPWMASLAGVAGTSVPAEKLTLREEGLTLKAVELTFWVGEDQKAPTRLRGAIILEKKGGPGAPPPDGFGR